MMLIYVMVAGLGIILMSVLIMCIWVKQYEKNLQAHLDKKVKK